ncbi:hypothetical protein DL95DRAFT_367500 [Leptodontidium sp. 2 PMI_412]|nr:hypothetical protein DL95DRAFT_367500 [Leptodontidium sp. 2 PMI_412]
MFLQTALSSAVLPRRLFVDINSTVTTIFQFSSPATLENLVVRGNGEILVTSGQSRLLYQVSPNPGDIPILVTQIPGVSSIQGVVELEPDIFYVLAQNITGLTVIPSTIALWRVDLNQLTVAEDRTVLQPAAIQLVARIPEGVLFNGMCRLSPSDNSNLLISDSMNATITIIDVHTGIYKTVISNPLMEYLPTGLTVGVNGIHVHGSDLFFTNFNRAIFARIPISLRTGEATGPAQVVVNGTAGDDFILSEDGNKAYLALWGRNEIAEVDVRGRAVRAVATSPILEASSAVAWGRGLVDQNSLYVSAGNSGVGTAMTGTVARVDLR